MSQTLLKQIVKCIEVFLKCHFISEDHCMKKNVLLTLFLQIEVSI